MLNVTENASEHLAQLLEQADAPTDVAIRFLLEGQELGLHLDSERPGDESFSHDGRTVLLLDSQVAQLLTEQTLDAQETEAGVQLTFV